MKTFALHRIEVSATREKRDVLSGCREPAAEISANTTRAKNCDSHSFTASRLTTGSSPITAAL